MRRVVTSAFIFGTVLSMFLIFLNPTAGLARSRSGIWYQLDESWQELNSPKNGPRIYGKGKLLRFMIGQIDSSGTDAQQWAHDEAESFKAHPGASVIQWPKPVRYGDRSWFQIQMEDTKQVQGSVIHYTQWYSQKEPSILLEVILAGPPEEVETNLKGIETVLAGTKIVEVPSPSGTFQWTSARVGEMPLGKAPLDKNKIMVEMGMASLNPPSISIERGSTITGYLLRSSKLFDRPPRIGDAVHCSEETLYTEQKTLQDGTRLYGGQVTDMTYQIKSVKYLGKGIINVTESWPLRVRAKFYEVQVEVK